MRAWILSDLHCDHGAVPPPVPDNADIALIAGDVMNDEWLVEIAQKLPVIFVAGNHEFYKRDIPSVLDRYFEDFTGGPLHFLDNDTLRLNWCGHEQVRISGATLWTDYNNDPRAAETARRSMNDHRYISWRKEPWQRFLPSHATKMYRESLRYLQDSGADVIITHHAPHPGSVHPRYEGQLLNYAYFSHALEKFDKPPRLWIHGHTHDVFDYMVGETRVVCNPMGYWHERGNGFNPALILEI